MGKKGDFFSHGVWRIRTKELKWTKSLGVKILRVFILIGQGFTRKQVQVGAASLAYYSLLATVPLLAFFFGVARGFLLQKIFRDWLIRSFDQQQVVVDQLTQFAENSLKYGGEGVIVGAGLLLLLWAGLRILMNLELALNRIWEVKKGRSFARKFSDYMALFFIGPIFALVSMSLTAYFSASLADLGQKTLLYDVIAPIFNLISLFLIWTLFTFLYIFIPTTKVNFKSALWAGLITALIYQIVQWAYIYFQIGVAKYSAIYGTLSALPLFLIWLHISWLIILIGAKMTFAFQNVNAYEFMTEDVHLSHHFRHILCLRIAHHIVKRFVEKAPPPSTIELSNALIIPLPLVNRLTSHLVDAGVIADVRVGKKLHEGFQPALSIEDLTIKDVLDMISHRGEEIPLPEGDEVENILKYFDAEDAVRLSQANLNIKDI